MDKENGVILRNKRDSKRIRQCRVVFSYKQDHEDELNLNIGDVIDILGEEEEGWWRGILNGKIGVFPSNFVEEIHFEKLKRSREDLNVSNDGDGSLPLPPKPAKILCEVKYSYKAQNEDELNLKEGDIVILLSKDGQDPGWWKGELNGAIGVFPDNFVVILPYNADKNSSEKSPTISQDPLPLRPSSIASQRRSLENKNQNHSERIDSFSHGDNKSIPPVPSKKPAIAAKKSPSSTVSSGGLFSGIKKKIVDVVDGATSSKSTSPSSKTESENVSENVFDQVERVSLLTDVRATRVKAPAGRRPPSVVFREEETGVPNGNVEPLNLEIVNEQLPSTDIDGCEVKPKLREWEKHKAPWLAEMKLSQAKRTSPSPGAPENKLKLTPTEKAESEEGKVESKTTKPVENEMSKSLTSLTSTPLTSKVKSESEKVPLRPKPNLTNIPTPRPASIQSVSPNVTSAEVAQKPPTPSHPKLSPISKTPSPLLHKQEKNASNEVKVLDNDLTISFKQYTDLVERIHKLEMLVEKQNVIHAAAIDELKGKLQLETEMRHMLQVGTSPRTPTPIEQRMNPEDRQEELKYRKYSASCFICLLLALSVILSTYIWCTKFHEGFSWGMVEGELNFHFLLSIGFLLVYSKAVLFRQIGKYVFGFMADTSQQSKFWIISLLKVVVFVLFIGSLLAILDFKKLKNPPKGTVYSLHGCLGYFAISFFLLDFLCQFIGTIHSFRRYWRRELFPALCWISSMVAFANIIYSCLTGLEELALSVYKEEYKTLPDGALIVNSIGCLVLLFGVLVLNIVFKRRKFRST